MGPTRVAFCWTVLPLGLRSTVAAAIALIEGGVAPEQAGTEVA